MYFLDETPGHNNVRSNAQRFQRGLCVFLSLLLFPSPAIFSIYLFSLFLAFTSLFLFDSTGAGGGGGHTPPPKKKNPSPVVVWRAFQHAWSCMEDLRPSSGHGHFVFRSTVDLLKGHRLFRVMFKIKLYNEHLFSKSSGKQMLGLHKDYGKSRSGTAASSC